MSRTKEDHNVDQRQYLCISKYDKIVNQFDELVNMVDMVTKAPKNRHGSASNSKGEMVGENGIKGSKSSSTDKDENGTGGAELVQLIANHLLDLNHPHKSWTFE